MNNKVPKIGRIDVYEWRTGIYNCKTKDILENNGYDGIL